MSRKQPGSEGKGKNIQERTYKPKRVLQVRGTLSRVTMAGARAAGGEA